jgi:hypothetical protein
MAQVCLTRFNNSIYSNTNLINQKAKKELAQRNTAKLNQTLYFTIAIHAFFLLLRLFVLRNLTTRSLIKYLLLSTPSLLIQFWFERISRPTYTSPTASSPDSRGDLRSAGEDLEAKGLTEFLWDVLYWSWGCIVLAAALGDGVWWLWLVVPGYAAYLAWTTFMGARSGMKGMMGGEQAEGAGTATSKRQAKLEKRGGQRVAYR